MSIRVRYAPSPTGMQHIGGVRTALFNYFLSRARKGKFILRIEDTDRERFNENALTDIYETFSWLGIKWDEGPDVGGDYGPYFQSQREKIYRQFTQKLIENDKAYYCYCTQERLEKLRQEQIKHKSSLLGYDRHCRNISEKEKSDFKKQNKKAVIRFKIPLEGSTVLHDELLGDIERTNSDINPDPVILKSDGFPTYHLANIVDDHLMKISHVLRAQEWISSGPLHILLYNAFNWKPPLYCHLPMVMGMDGHKLSKRHGATSILEFREKGYLPEALINYISLLGWSHDNTKEFFSVKELETLFSLEKLNKAAAVFDYKKLDWFNGTYIRRLNDDELTAYLLPFLKKNGLIGSAPTKDERKLIQLFIPLVRERLVTLSDISDLVRFLFCDIEIKKSEDLIPKKTDKKRTIELLKKTEELIEDFFKHSDEENEQIFRNTAKNMGVKLGVMLMPLRVALTGSAVSLPLFESIKILGREKTVTRIDAALSLLYE